MGGAAVTDADLIQWLRDRTVPVGACWEWLGAQGGGKAPGQRRPACKWQGRTVYVARLVVATMLGRPLKRGMLAVHSCDNPRCVHPNHLAEGSYSRNLAAAWARGRRPRTFTET